MWVIVGDKQMAQDIQSSEYHRRSRSLRRNYVHNHNNGISERPILLGFTGCPTACRCSINRLHAASFLLPSRNRSSFRFGRMSRAISSFSEYRERPSSSTNSFCTPSIFILLKGLRRSRHCVRSTSLCHSDDLLVNST